MKRMWAPEELKKKTIKDVNDAIEDGEIDVSDNLGITYNSANLIWYFGDNEDFKIFINDYVVDAGIVVPSSFAIVNQSDNNLMNLYTDNDGNIFGSIGYDHVNDKPIIELLDIDSEPGAFIQTIKVNYIMDSDDNWGSENQVLGNIDGAVCWIDQPSKLYANYVKIETSGGQYIGHIRATLLAKSKITTKEQLLTYMETYGDVTEVEARGSYLDQGTSTLYSVINLVKDNNGIGIIVFDNSTNSLLTINVDSLTYSFASKLIN